MHAVCAHYEVLTARTIPQFTNRPSRPFLPSSGPFLFFVSSLSPQPDHQPRVRVRRGVRPVGLATRRIVPGLRVGRVAVHSDRHAPGGGEDAVEGQGRLTPHVWLGFIRPRSQCVGGMLLVQWCYMY